MQERRLVVRFYVRGKTPDLEMSRALIGTLNAAPVRVRRAGWWERIFGRRMRAQPGTVVITQINYVCVAPDVWECRVFALWSSMVWDVFVLTFEGRAETFRLRERKQWPSWLCWTLEDAR